MSSQQLVARLRAAGCVFAEQEAVLLAQAAQSAEQLAEFVAQRVQGVPLEHVVGWAEFCGLRILVDRGVFVPRPRTELLVAAARARLTATSTVLDLCCGTGAVGVAVAAGSGVELVASDINPRAVGNARRNVEPIGGRVFLSDVYDGLPADLRACFDVVTVVAPYVPTDAIPLLPREARDFEPLSALDGGRDGLELVRRVVAEAPRWLAPRGTLLTEVSERQVSATLALVTAAGLAASVESNEQVDSWVVLAERW